MMRMVAMSGPNVTASRSQPNQISSIAGDHLVRGRLLLDERRALPVDLLDEGADGIAHQFRPAAEQLGVPPAERRQERAEIDGADGVVGTRDIGVGVLALDANR